MRKASVTNYTICLVAVFFLTSFVKQEKLGLDVRVHGGKPNIGTAMISLFNSEEDFLKKSLHSQEKPIDKNGEAHFHFSGLPKGKYAVAVTYDEDNNGELNTGFLGIPTELVGFSNNVKGRWGPPSFEKASFQLDSSSDISIRLGKAKD